MEDYLRQVKRRENKKSHLLALAALEVVLNNRVFNIRLPLSGIQNPPGKTVPAGIIASTKKMRDRATPNAFNIVICYLPFTKAPVFHESALRPVTVVTISESEKN